MRVAPRRFVKPLAPPVVAQREEAEALAQIKNFEVCPTIHPSLAILRPRSLTAITMIGWIGAQRFCNCVLVD